MAPKHCVQQGKALFSRGCFSGTGKSSLCSYIYGYRQDYQGIINFDEQNIRSLSVNEWADIRKHSLSILFQEPSYFPPGIDSS